MKKTYSDLNLKAIREALNIDFAHFTYKQGQCSCCYGPKDLPKMYWKDRTIPEGDDYSYILFKNANNGSGTVMGRDYIKHNQYIEWGLNEEQLDGVCKMLQEQLGSRYKVIKPEDNRETIIIEEEEL